MKKLLLLLPVFASLILAWCWSSATPEKEIVEEKVAVQEPAPQAEPSEEKEEQQKEKSNEADDDHPHNGTEWDNHHDDDQHGDLNELFAWVSFSSDKEQTIDGYDIVIKHKDDIHAGEKLTWTITVTQWWNPLDWFEKIDGDEWVWVVKDPVDHLEHLHPLANTNNTLTFSSHTHDAWEYEVITQFQHNWNKITVPYKLTLLENVEGHHD